MTIYSHVLPNMQDEAAAAIENALTQRVGIRGPRSSSGLYFTILIFLQMAIKEEWRDPDSNRGHHDFRACPCFCRRPSLVAVDCS
jgi:hypothetical protein